MNKLVLDIHTHTIASGHAYGTVREMASAAKEKDLKLLGITEHAPGIPGTCSPFYFLNLNVIPRTLYGVEIMHGSEINVLNDGKLSLEERYIDKLDYCIAGIHRQCYENAGIEANTENLISCMSHPKVRFVSHPDDDHTPLDYEKLVVAAKNCHVALELNNSSLTKPEKRLNCVENYKTMLGLCAAYEVPVYIGSDAHDPSWVGEFGLAENLLEELNWNRKWVLNASADRFKKFIAQ